METVNCNLCGSDVYDQIYTIPDYKYFPDEWFSVARCRKCGLGFTNPRPTRTEIGKYYPASFFAGFETERDFHERRYAREAELVHRLTAGKTGRLLDIGCANGDFPRHMAQRGWSVEGVENSLSSRPITDFLVYQQEFATIPVEQPVYDVITAWAVFEHLHDPMAYFQKAAQVLKPGGKLIFLATNFESITSCRLFREDVPRHLYFYTEACVRRYCQRTGLELVKTYYNDYIYDAPPVNWLIYYLKYRLRGRAFTWHDAGREERMSRPAFLERHGLSPGWLSSLRFLLSQPVYVLDRLLQSAFARAQMWARRYGVAIYVAEKPAGAATSQSATVSVPANMTRALAERVTS